LFRDAAATSIAIDDPEHVTNIMRVLGHSTLAKSERHYNQARGLEAGRRYQATIQTIRAPTRSPGEVGTSLHSTDQNGSTT
jgi:integrase/recombinase XerD